MPRRPKRFTEQAFTYLTPAQLDALRVKAWAMGVLPATLIRNTIVDALSLPCDPMDGADVPRETSRGTMF